MCEKQESDLFQSFCLPSGAIVALTLVVLLLGFGFDAGAISSEAGPATTTGQTGTDQTAATSSFTNYVPKGYSMEGPLTIVSATTEAIKFFSGRTKKPLVLKLTGTQLTVRDADNKVLKFSTLVEGVTVYVCRSTDQKTVIVFVKSSSGKGQRNDV